MNFFSELQRKGFRVQVSGMPNELRICCPFCELRGKTPDDGYKLGFNTRTGMAHCFRCGWKTRNGFDHFKLPRAAIATQEMHKAIVTDAALPDDFELLATGRGYWANEARSYLSRRGMTSNQIESHQVGLSLIGKSRMRVVFPVYDEKKLMGWSGRTLITDHEPKWLHSSGLRSVYWARRGSDTLVIVEGIFDAIAIERGIPTVAVMALLGTNLTEEKRKNLNQYNNIVIWLDPDSAGRKAATELLQRLIGRNVTIILNGSSDPGDMSNEELDRTFRSRSVCDYETELRKSMESWL